MSFIVHHLIGARLSRRFLEEISALGSAAGSGTLTLLLLALDPRRGWLALGGIIIATVLGAVIKTLWRTRRPDHDAANLPSALADRIDASTFPSVHALRVAALGTIVWGSLESFERVVLVLLMLGVIVSRVALRRHRWIDVVGGSVLGMIVGLSVLRFF